MKISSRGHYALRAMVDLATHEQERPRTAASISLLQEIPSSYLEQLLLKLRKSGLIHSVRGPQGGFLLAKKPSAVTIGDILKAVEESIYPSECVENLESSGGCEKAEGCVTHIFYEKLARQIDETLNTVTLEELCSEAERFQGLKGLKHNYNFHI